MCEGGFTHAMTISVCLSVASGGGRRLNITDCTEPSEQVKVNIYDDAETMKVDYRVQYYDVITNPRWRTAASMKIVFFSRYISENDPIMLPRILQFGFKFILKHRFWPSLGIELSNFVQIL